MFASTLSLVTLFSFSNALAITRREDVPYHYMPVDFDFGANERVTTNFTFGTATDLETVQVVMDTGSSNFWLWQKGAVVHWGSQYLGVAGPCNVTVPTEYDYGSSPTAVISNHSSANAYAGNAKIVSGALYSNDTLTAINGSGSIPNVQFAMENYGIIRQLDDGTCSSIDYDKAILGLSPFTNTTTGPSFRQNLFDAGQIASKTMVMWFDKHTGTLGRLTGGVLFGAIDTSKYTGSLVQVPNTRSDYEVGLYVPKPNITFNNQTFIPDEDTNCLLDSGTHGDALPFDFQGTIGSSFYNSSGGQLVDYNGVVAYNGACEDIPQELEIGYTWAGVDASESVTVSVPLRNYARGAKTFNSTYGLCLLNLEIGGCTFGAPFSSASFLAVDDAEGSIALAQGGVSEEGSGVDSASLKTIGVGETFDTV